MWPEELWPLSHGTWFPPPALTLAFLQFLGGRGWTLAARERTEDWSQVLTWLLEGPMKTDMLSEADIRYNAPVCSLTHPRKMVSGMGFKTGQASYV